MHSWNYKTNTGFFDSHCGMTNGSAGEFQPSNLQVNGSISLFTPDMCRTIPLDYVEQVEVQGVLGYKYSGGERSVDNGKTFIKNIFNFFIKQNIMPHMSGKVEYRRLKNTKNN